MNKEPYLADVQVGDKLYNFLENNKEYTVVEVIDEKILTTCPIIVKPTDGRDDVKVKISYHGTEIITQDIPYYLYAPVDVLDPKNLPPRPWRPKRGEWVLALYGHEWNLSKYSAELEDGRHEVETTGRVFVKCTKVAPFTGKLPPGLEKE